MGMCRYNIPEPYEKLKAFTRGQAVTQQSMQEFVNGIDGLPAGAQGWWTHCTSPSSLAPPMFFLSLVCTPELQGLPAAAAAAAAAVIVLSLCCHGSATGSLLSAPSYFPCWARPFRSPQQKGARFTSGAAPAVCSPAARALHMPTNILDICVPCLLTPPCCQPSCNAC